MNSISTIAAALVCLATAHAQNVTGRWTGNFSTTDNGLQIEVALNQSGGQVSGYLVSPRFEGNFVEGKVEGNTVTLKVDKSAKNFKNVKKGDQVVARYTEAVAISVQKP